MNNLEKKFKVPKDKILIDEKLWKHLVSKIEKLQQQLDNQKYLEKEEVTNIVWNLDNALRFWYQNTAGTEEQNSAYIDMALNIAITAICSLAIPENKQIEIMKGIIKSLEHDVEFWKNKSRGIAIRPLTRDRIIEVLDKHKKFDEVKSHGHCLFYYIDELDFSHIAQEIIEGKEGEE